MKLPPEVKAAYETDKALKRLEARIVALDQKKKDQIRIMNNAYVVRRMGIVRRIGERKLAIQNNFKNRMEEKRHIEWRRSRGYRLHGPILHSLSTPS